LPVEDLRQLLAATSPKAANLQHAPTAAIGAVTQRTTAFGIGCQPRERPKLGRVTVDAPSKVCRLRHDVCLAGDFRRYRGCWRPPYRYTRQNSTGFERALMALAVLVEIPIAIIVAVRLPIGRSWQENQRSRRSSQIRLASPSLRMTHTTIIFPS
jgi:hypothetical protein